MMRSPANNIEHLHFVLHDPLDFPFPEYPRQSCLLVSATTIRAPRYDDTCVLEPGCHVFITDSSYIAYSFALVRSAAALEDGVRSGLFRDHEPADAGLVRRILACMDASPRTSGELRQAALHAWNASYGSRH